MLSKRILYFVDEKIYFHCPLITLSENCRGSLWRPQSSAISMLEPLVDYKALIVNYSLRVLTAQGDALRAVSGIMRRISETMQWDFVSGLPDVAFENIMLFRKRLYPLSRRRGFPSYSWLGWRGSLDFVEGLYRFDIWIKWYVRNPSGAIRPVQPSLAEIRSVPAKMATNEVHPSQTPDFGLTGVRLNRGFPSENITLDSPPGFPLLQFWTLAVFFELRVHDYAEGIVSVAGPMHLGELGRVGRVYLDAADEYPFPTHGELLLLCRTVPSTYDVSSLKLGSNKEMYAVMLIEWNEKVAERRGIGFLDPACLEQSLAPGPVWKEVILG